MVSNIKDDDISFVVQGPVNKTETKKCLESIRKLFPNSEIILSTWKDTDTSFLEGLYDVVLYNTDPGAGYYCKTEKFTQLNNVNRQLVSSREGLKCAKRKYAMKLRSDIILSNDSFLKYMECYQSREERYSLFKHKVLASSVATRFSYNDYEEGNRIPSTNVAFHVSDWWFFGLKEDLIKYFDIPLMKEPEFSEYFLFNENKDKFNPFYYPDCTYMKFVAEQYFALECFKKQFSDIQIEHCGDISETIIEQSRRYLINNFIFLEYDESGIYFKKHLISKYHWLSPSYTDLYNKYRREYEYNKYCDNSYKINALVKYVIENQNYQNSRRELMMHFQRAIGRKLNNHNQLMEIFITLVFVTIHCLKNIKYIILYLRYNEFVEIKGKEKK